MASHPERRQAVAATNGLRAAAAIDQLDATARSMEARWGVGRLRLLVDLDLAARFDRQRDWLRCSIAADDPTLIVTTTAMRRDWTALDAVATAAGAEPLAPTIWQKAARNERVCAEVAHACCMHIDAVLNSETSF